MTQALPYGTSKCTNLQLVCKLDRRATQRNAMYLIRNQQDGDGNSDLGYDVICPSRSTRRTT